MLKHPKSQNLQDLIADLAKAARDYGIRDPGVARQLAQESAHEGWKSLEIASYDALRQRVREHLSSERIERIPSPIRGKRKGGSGWRS